MISLVLQCQFTKIPCWQCWLQKSKVRRGYLGARHTTFSQSSTHNNSINSHHTSSYLHLSQQINYLHSTVSLQYHPKNSYHKGEIKCYVPVNHTSRSSYCIKHSLVTLFLVLKQHMTVTQWNECSNAACVLKVRRKYPARISRCYRPTYKTYSHNHKKNTKKGSIIRKIKEINLKLSVHWWANWM